jgi:hypothetical protein
LTNSAFPTALASGNTRPIELSPSERGTFFFCRFILTGSSNASHEQRTHASEFSRHIRLIVSNHSAVRKAEFRELRSGGAVLQKG